MAPRTGNWIDDAAPKQDWWNAAVRWTGKDIMDIFAYMLRGDAPATGGVVLGGLACSVGSGATSDVAVGAAVHYDATIYTSTVASSETASSLGLQLLEAADNLAHSDGDGTFDRIDIITIASTLSTDRSKSVQQDGGSTTPQNTRWGQLTTVQVTEGTPAGSPSAPATPTGHTKLCEVLVPTGTVSGTWAANVTYTDFRRFAAGPLRYQSYWRGYPLHTPGLNFLNATGKGTVWDLADSAQFSIAHLNSTAETLYCAMPIAPPRPGMKITGLKIESQVGTVFGSSGGVSINLSWHDASSPGVPASLGSGTLSNTVAHHTDTITIAAGDQKVFDEGDLVWVEFTIFFDATADAANILLKGAQVQWEEGHPV